MAVLEKYHDFLEISEKVTQPWMGCDGRVPEVWGNGGENGFGLYEVFNLVQDKIFKIIEAIETLERVPSSYLKSIEGVIGLFEARIQLASNIWRVFCFFDNDRLVILLNGFQKKTQKTPKKEIERAIRLMAQYHQEKSQ